MPKAALPPEVPVRVSKDEERPGRIQLAQGSKLRVKKARLVK